LAALAARQSGREILQLEGQHFLRLTEAAAAALNPEDVAA
jgi:hypothetical protein